MKIQKKFLVALIALLAVAGVTFAQLVLWQKPLTLLRTNAGVSAHILTAYATSYATSVPNTIAVLNLSPTDTTVMNQTFNNPDQYIAVIGLYSVNPSNLATLTLNVSCSGVPAYLNVNISSIDIMTCGINVGLTAWEKVSDNYIVDPATGGAQMNTTYPITVSSALYDPHALHNGYEEGVGIVIVFNVNQISFSTDATVSMTPSFTLSTT